MRIIITILLCTLAAGYFIQHYFLPSLADQWYCYFVTNDAKAFLIALALMSVTRRTKNFPFAFCAVLITGADLALQIADVNIKGNWSEIIYISLVSILIAFIIVRTLTWYLRRHSI